MFVCQLAAEWRQTFHQDAIVDIVCYRKSGHNEQDEPRFTQPIMYQKITKKENIMSMYREKLASENVVTLQESQEMIDKTFQILSEALENAHTYPLSKKEWLSSVWEELKSINTPNVTGVPLERLREVGKALHTIPKNFELHQNLTKLLKYRQEVIETGRNIDWGTAEGLAYGTLLMEGIHVRLSGQDVERGTFSHRHAVYHDQKNGSTYTPLNHISPGIQENFIPTNSSLSEFGVVGFELGYSYENPNSLVIWEAQVFFLPKI